MALDKKMVFDGTELSSFSPLFSSFEEFLGFKNLLLAVRLVLLQVALFYGIRYLLNRMDPLKRDRDRSKIQSNQKLKALNIKVLLEITISFSGRLFNQLLATCQRKFGPNYVMIDPTALKSLWNCCQAVKKTRIAVAVWQLNVLPDSLCG